MIDSQHGRRVFALQVAGLEYRYHSHPPPSSSNLDSTVATGINYTDLEAITSVGSFSASIDPSGGIAQYGAVSVSLGIDSKRGGLDDPGIVFGRCGARSASTRGRLSSSASRTDATLNLSTDLTGLTYPRLLHIGAETIRAASATITTVTVSRGAGGTPQQSHSTGLEGSVIPELTTEITTFRGRRAKLYMAHRYPSGETSSYTEIINGFIESSPIIEDGREITLNLLPLTALIDTNLSDKGIAQTRLLQDYHYYDGVNGSVLEYGLGLERIVDEDLFVTPDTSGTITASAFDGVVSSRQNSAQLFDDFDVSLPKGPDADNYPREHPRYPKLRKAEEFVFVSGGVFPTSITYDSNVPGFGFVADGSLTNALNASEISATSGLYVRLPLGELKQHQLGTGEVKRWPDVVNDVLINDGPNSTSGLSGGFGRWRVNPDNTIRFEKLSSSPFRALLWLWQHPSSWRTLSEFYAANFGMRQSFRWGANGVRGAMSSMGRLFYPLPLAREGQPILQSLLEDPPTLVRLGTTPTGTTSTFQMQDTPRAYYQHFESVILVENSLGLPTSAGTDEYYITVQYQDLALDEMRHQVFKVTHETTASFGGSNVGYLIHISDDNDAFQNTSFGDWTDRERALIYKGGQLNGELCGTALLKLLQSGGGDQINGNYDLLGIGLNISEDNIDIDSFLRLDVISPIQLSANFLGDGADLRETFESLLRLAGATLVMIRDSSTGRAKLSVQPIGNERPEVSELTILSGDWIADPPPHWGIYEDIVTQIKYQFGYDPAEAKYTEEVIFNNQEAINRYGGERSAITLQLAGVTSEQFGRGAGDSFAFFTPNSARIFNLLSNPLRVWRGAIGTGQSAYIDVGSYLKVSSPHLKGYDDSYGVTDGVGQVRSIRQELMGEGCEIELITTGLSPVNWNSAAQVLAYTSTTVTVAESTYSGASVTDASFFAVGDVVDYVPQADHDSAITGLTISQIVGNVLTFTAAHGISSTLGTIEPTTYANASADHRLDAYLANDSDIIDSNVDAQEFS